MNEDILNKTPRWAWALGIIGTFLIVALLGLALLRRQTPPLDVARQQERSKALADVRAADAQGLQNAAWIDRNKGVVRLPMDVAMATTLQAWQEPAAAKSELVSRARKAATLPAGQDKAAPQPTPGQPAEGKPPAVKQGQPSASKPADAKQAQPK